MNPKFALPVDTTEERLQTVVATAPISLRLRSHGCDHALGGQGSLSRTSGSNPGQLTRAVSGRTKWWPGGATFSFCIRPRRKSTQDLSLARGLLTRTSGRENRYQSIITEPYQSMIAFLRRAPHAYLMECRQGRTALADEPQPGLVTNYLFRRDIDFRN